ncbi:MAG: UDP-N-acetylmuramoyl-tripeptide--D-alanyl-D-alanine ligase, partial [Gammaproteobacteria bacterium]|nr:UDP-N-acetylmuramoyl-tripeptide--D-alanyl-D-alanine ligase [Gammaproteobacteria bacterium]
HAFIPSAYEKGAAGAVVQSPLVNSEIPQIKVKNTVQALAELATQWRSQFEIPVIAITGSNGKTTVKEMVGSILGIHANVLATKGNLNNHLGVPLTLFDLAENHKYAVIEMGANHAGDIAGLCKIAMPTVAVITQCAPAHLEGFKTEQGVAQAKSEIFSGLKSNGTAIINADDKYSKFWSETADGLKTLYFGIQRPADIRAKNIRINSNKSETHFDIQFPESIIPINLPLMGTHNILNALAAAACCHAAGVPVMQIKQGLEKMLCIPGRMERLTGLHDSTIFNDTYNANPASLEAGLKVLSEFDGPRWLIFGDMGELGERSEEFHKTAGKLAKKYGIERLLTVGELSRLSHEEFGNGGEHFHSTDELLKQAVNELSGNVTILVKASRFMKMEHVVAGLREGG